MATKPAKKAAPKPVKALEPVGDGVTDDTAAIQAIADTWPKYADDDYSIDARMWRLEQDHIRMGARPK
jgi:hypothetical protein